MHSRGKNEGRDCLKYRVSFWITAIFHTCKNKHGLESTTFEISLFAFTTPNGSKGEGERPLNICTQEPENHDFWPPLGTPLL